MSFPDDSRPDTRRLVVWERVLTFAPSGAFLLLLAVTTLVPDVARYDGLRSDLWSDLTLLLCMVPLASTIAWAFVRRAKKNADARWALAQSRTAAPAARLAALDEPAAR